MERELKELRSKVTTKGQVTIPIEIRRLLGLEEHDTVAFVVDGDAIRLRRPESVVARTAGAMKSTKPPLSAEQLRETAEQAIAEEAIERMGT